MKTVITTVGTSIFTNYFEENKDKNTVKNYYDSIEGKPYSQYQEYENDINDLRKAIINHIEENKSNLKKLSAELKSLILLTEKEEEKLNVYLLATDSILSPLACEIIKQTIDTSNDLNMKIIYNNKTEVINDLQVLDDSNLKNGLSNLIRRINDISQGYYQNVIMNITGGYKGIIPYLTIISSINKCKIIYTFENERNSLINIPVLPISINEKIFEDNLEQLNELEDEDTIEQYKKVKNRNYEKWEVLENSGIIDVVDNMASFSSIGKIFFDNYKNKFFIFKCPEDVWKDIEKQKDIKRILETKFHNESIRENKTENKNSHLVYDDGNNVNRIFYFIDKNNIYIYKTFQDEEAQKKYINEPSSITDKIKNDIISKSKVRKIVKTKNTLI